MIFKTKNLTLRPWKTDDAEYLYEYASNPKLALMAGWMPHENIEYSLNIIKTVYCRSETYAVVKNSIPIGCVELLIHPDCKYYWGEGCGEVTYWISPEFWGHGLTAEALTVLIERGFYDLNLKKIYATFESNNFQSKRVLEKLNFKYVDELYNINYLNETFKEIIMLKEAI